MIPRLDNLKSRTNRKIVERKKEIKYVVSRCCVITGAEISFSRDPSSGVKLEETLN